MAWENKGRELHFLGRLDEALHCYDKALSLDSRDAGAWQKKGAVLAVMGKLADAIACCDRALALNPRSLDSLSNKGLFLVGLGEDTQARACFEQVLAIDPQFEMAWIEKGKLLAAGGRHEDALPCFDQVIAINSGNAEAHSNKATSLAALGRSEEALASCDGALKADPRCAAAWATKGAVLAATGNVTDAVACYDKALEEQHSASRQQAPPDAAKFPDPADPNHRVTCNEIAEQLSKIWRFKWQVILSVTGLFVAIAAALGTIVGVGLYSMLTSGIRSFENEERLNIDKAKHAIEEQIAEEFKKENVQQTVKAAATDQAAKLLADSVNPSIETFQKKVGTLDKDVDQRFKEFQELVKKNEQGAASHLEGLRNELLRLQKRNNITALADKAIYPGDLESFRKLEKMGSDSQEPEEQEAAQAELTRVYQVFYPAVAHNSTTHLNASAINPKKSKEEELELDELLPLLDKIPDFGGRLRTVEIITEKAKRGSYKTAEALYEAMKKETNLYVRKALDSAFEKTTGRGTGGNVDRRELLQWFEENKERLKKEDADPKPSPTPTP